MATEEEAQMHIQDVPSEEAPREVPPGAGEEETTPTQLLATLSFHQHRLAGELAALRGEEGHTLSDVVSRVASLEHEIRQLLKTLHPQRACESDPAGQSPVESEVSDGQQSTKPAKYAPRPRPQVDFVVLPEDWPQGIGPRFAATNMVGQASTAALASMTTSTSGIFEQDDEVKFRMQLSTDDSGSASAVARCLQFIEKYCIRDPTSNKHMALSMLTLLALIWDLTVIPYALAWAVPFEGNMLSQAWILTCFWTFDLASSFLTGHHADGELITDPRIIARAYLRSWFAPDLLVVLCDWTSMLFVLVEGVEETSALKTFRFVKLGRLLRIVNMLRVLKIVRILEELVEQHFQESQRLALRFVYLFFALCWIGHLVSCCWYAIGIYAHSDTGMRWTDSLAFGTQDLQWYTYTSSFHWSISQLSLGSVDITSYNSAERLFSVLCLICGLLFGSVFISLLSAKMVEFQVSMMERYHKLRKLHSFLSENNIHRKVALRVQRQVTERLNEKSWLTDKDVAAIQLLSVSVRRELNLNYFQPHIILHPLFRLFDDMEHRLVSHICLERLQMRCLRPTDEVFAPGPAKSTTFLLTTGKMSYSQEPESSRVEHPSRVAVDPGHWVAEAALWSVWTYVGCLQASTCSKVVEVGSQAMEVITRSDTACGEIALCYCRAFHNRILSAHPPDVPWPNDLQVPFTEYGDLVMSMDRKLQIVISRVALWHKERRGFGTYFLGAREKLEEEVQQGKCTLVVNGQGIVERVAAVVVFHLEQPLEHLDVTRSRPRLSTSSATSAASDVSRGESIRGSFGRTFFQGLYHPRSRSSASDRADDLDLLFVQLGKQEEAGPLLPTCQMPGTKMRWGESRADAYQRILWTSLAPMADNVDCVSWERRIEWNDSKVHGVHTKYLITVCKGKMRASIRAPTYIITPEKMRSMLLDRCTVTSSDNSSFPVVSRVYSRRMASSDPSIAREGMQVYKFDKSNGGVGYYAWLSQEWFDFLRSHAGASVLTRLLAGFDSLSFSSEENGFFSEEAGQGTSTAFDQDAGTPVHHETSDSCKDWSL